MVELVHTDAGSRPFDYRPATDHETYHPVRRVSRIDPQPKRRLLKTKSSPDISASWRFQHYFPTSLSQLTPILFSSVVVGVLFTAWLYRNEGHITAETGVGYWLGIVGASMMLLLLLYPLRKRIKIMRSWGRVSHWFGAHMILGVVGPALVLLHSNFQFGSLNSSVALLAMLLVAGSGLVGRYLYSRIHAGLYGRKTEVRTLLEDADAIEEILGRDLSHAEVLIDDLRTFEEVILASSMGPTRSLWTFLSVGSKCRRHARRARKLASTLVDQHARENGLGWWARRQMLHRTNQYCTIYFAAVKRAARFSVFESLFRMWHVLHLPLFFLLVLAAIAHIIAVHLY